MSNQNLNNLKAGANDPSSWCVKKKKKKKLKANSLISKIGPEFSVLILKFDRLVCKFKSNSSVLKEIFSKFDIDCRHLSIKKKNVQSVEFFDYFSLYNENGWEFGVCYKCSFEEPLKFPLIYEFWNHYFLYYIWTDFAVGKTCRCQSYVSILKSDPKRPPNQTTL